jgi:hypothetical protein
VYASNDGVDFMRLVGITGGVVVRIAAGASIPQTLQDAWAGQYTSTALISNDALRAVEGEVWNGTSTTASAQNIIDEAAAATAATNIANAAYYLTTEKSKLAGIADAATANSTDATLLNRANHTGSQAISTITSLQTTLNTITKVSCIPLLSYGNAVYTLTNMVAAESFMNTVAGTLKYDLTNYTQARLVMYVSTVGTAGSKVVAKYKTTFATSDAITAFSALGTSAIEASMAVAGVITSAWVNLAAGAIGDVFLTLARIGGDGVADPVIAYVMLEVK